MHRGAPSSARLICCSEKQTHKPTHRSNGVKPVLSCGLAVLSFRHICEAFEGLGSAGLRNVSEKLTKTQQVFGPESFQGKINFQHKGNFESWSHFML